MTQADKHGKHRWKLHLWPIAILSLIVPRRFRSQWRQEWEGELEYREYLLQQWEKITWRAKLGLIARGVSAFWDVLWFQPRRWEDEMVQDIRYAIRMLFKSPGFTAVVVMSLALGIGANTAVFSLIDAVLLKPLPVKEPQQLVLFNWISGPKLMISDYSGSKGKDPATGLTTGASFLNSTFEQFRDRNQTLSDLFAFAAIQQLNINIDNQADIAAGQVVTGAYFDALGVRALAGRTILPTDDQPAASPVVVISYEYWKSRLALEPAVVGKSIFINNVAFTVIGITPPEFHGTLDIDQSPYFTIPMSMEPRIRPNNSSLNDRPDWWLIIMGRLKPGVKAESAQANFATIFQQTVQENWLLVPTESPAKLNGTPDSPSLRVASGSQGLSETRARYSEPLTILMVVVALVLLIACVNVANLLLARASTRRKEVAVRLAMGASRLRLMRQFLTESILLAVLGGALGTVLAYWGASLLLAMRLAGGRPPAIETKLDLRVLGFTVAVSVITGVMFGLAPALRAAGIALIPALKDGGRDAGGRSRSWLGKGLVITQVALSLLLLVGAGLFLRTLKNLEQIELGFNRQNLLLFRVDPRLSGYRGAQLANLYEAMVQRFQSIPGVRAVSFSRHPLISGSAATEEVFIKGHAPQSGESNYIYYQKARANFFETMEIPLLLGRGLAPSDNDQSKAVAVINQTFAQRYFSGENPIGRRIGFSTPSNSDQIEVVGVVGDAKYSDLRQATPPTVYRPYTQPLGDLGQVNFEVRTAGDPNAIIASIRQATHEVDAKLPLFAIKTQEAQIDETLSEEKLFARLSTAFGILALALACIGLYGMMSYSVARRTNEIGIRMALGARPTDVRSLIMRESLVLVIIGLAVGLVAAVAATRLIKSMLYGLSPTDPTTMVAAGLTLIAVAALAGYLPARRASNVDPMVALRQD